MSYEDQRNIVPATPLEHIDKLATIGQSSQDKQKPSHRKSRRLQQPGVEQQLMDEQQQRETTGEDGHVDYHA